MSLQYLLYNLLIVLQSYTFFTNNVPNVLIFIVAHQESGLESLSDEPRHYINKVITLCSRGPF